MTVSLDTKSCKKCGLEKLVEQFHRAYQRLDGTWCRQTICKDCAKTKAQTYYRENQERLKEHNRKKAARYRAKNPSYDRSVKLRCKYGLSVEAWDALYDQQLGRCGICFTPFAEVKKTCVDHDHVNNRVRGLLCSNCNVGLGYFADDVESLRNAIKYLERPKAGDANDD